MCFLGVRNYSSPIVLLIIVLHKLNAGRPSWKGRSGKQNDKKAGMGGGGLFTAHPSTVSCPAKEVPAAPATGAVGQLPCGDGPRVPPSAANSIRVFSARITVRTQTVGRAFLLSSRNLFCRDLGLIMVGVRR